MLEPAAGIVIEDRHFFHVDFIKRELYDADNPVNVIPISAMERTKSGYRFHYDPERKNMAIEADVAKEGIITIHMRELVRLNAPAMAYQYGIPLEALAGKSDEEFFATLPALREELANEILDKLDYNLFEQRRAGILPAIEIDSNKFIVNWGQKVMYELNNPDNKVDFRKLHIHPHECQYLCFIDGKTGKLYDEVGPRDIKSSTRLCMVPDEAVIDPVGVARERGFNDIDLLHRFPMQKNISIESKPVVAVIANKRKDNGKNKGKGI